MNKVFYEHSKYLANLIGHSIRGTTPDMPTEEINWKQLYTIADFHNVTALISPIIFKLNIPDDIRQKFEYDTHRFMAREARQELEAQRVFSTLNKLNIPFIKLKGIVIKDLYPLPYMRTSADIDICISKEDRLRCRPVMQDLGYTLEESIDYNDAYQKDNFFIYELHSSIVSSRYAYHRLFTDPFGKAVKSPDDASYVLSPDYFYTHLIVHFMNHFLSGGCGIRQLCDLYVFERTHPELNINHVSQLLSPYKLSDFLICIRDLSFKLFEDKPLSDNEIEIANFIFKSGEHGNSDLKHVSWLSDDKQITWTFTKKCKYFIKLWFPGVKMMKKRYPILEKAPFLLPVCWIRRIFYAIFFKHSAIKGQRNEIRRLNSQELKEATHVRNLAGLK